jgi:REP element-mobilizing transposase RayT
MSTGELHSPLIKAIFAPIKYSMAYNPLLHHRRSMRLIGYDYSRAGAYFITICTQHRRCIFGEVVNGEMILNKYGQVAYDEWLKTPDIRLNISLDVFVVMPNHMHAIIVSIDKEADEYHFAPNAFALRAEEPVPFRSPSNTIGAIVRGYKSAVTKQINALNFDGQVWQRNYHDHIISTEQSYQNISSYIVNNPKKWSEDKFHRR